MSSRRNGMKRRLPARRTQSNPTRALDWQSEATARSPLVAQEWLPFAPAAGFRLEPLELSLPLEPLEFLELRVLLGVASQPLVIRSALRAPPSLQAPPSVQERLAVGPQLSAGAKQPEIPPRSRPPGKTTL